MKPLTLLSLCLLGVGLVNGLTPADKLRARLMSVSASDGFLFGHHEDNVLGRTWIDCVSGDPTCTHANGTLSDVKSATGKMPGMIGYDMAWTTVDPSVNYAPAVKEALQAGILVSLDFHVNNPVTGGKPQQHGGDPIVQILPGGTANTVWKQWLGYVADLVKTFPNDGFLFRPFHEVTLTGNTSWWWAVGAGVTPSQYRTAYNYTRSYLVDTLQVDNVLFSFAPIKPNVHTSAYPTNGTAPADAYYPGDDVIDVACFDSYDYDAVFPTDLVQSCELVVEFAKVHSKVPAVCEFGERDGLENSNNAHWFTDVFLKPLLASSSCPRIAYAQTWNNGVYWRPSSSSSSSSSVSSSALRYWTPVDGDPAFDDFRKFAASPQVLLAGET